jgi:hypothetical protein
MLSRGHGWHKAMHHFNIQTSVADPFHADPHLDPSFMSIRIWLRFRIQGFGDQKLRKNIQLKKNFIFKIKNSNLLIHGRDPA